MEVSRNGRPRRLAALKSEEKTKERFSKEPEPEAGSSRTLRSAKVMGDSTNERSESPQIFGPTQPSVNDSAKAKSPRRQRQVVKKNATKDNSSFIDVNEERSISSRSVLIRRTRSAKENTSTSSARPRRTKPPAAAAPPPQACEDEDDDLLILQEKIYHVRETRSKSKGRQVAHSSTKNNVSASDSSDDIAEQRRLASKTTRPKPKPRKEIPSTVVLSEDDDVDDETQYSASAGEQEVVSAPSEIAPVAINQDDDFGVDNIVQSIDDAACANEMDITTELVQETPPSTPSLGTKGQLTASPDMAALLFCDEREPVSNSNSPLVNRESGVGSVSVADIRTDEDANMSQDLFPSTFSQSFQQNFGESSNRSRAGRLFTISPPRPPLDTSMENSANSSSTVITVIEATKSHTRSPTEGMATSFADAFEPKKFKQMDKSKSQPTVMFPKPLKCVKGNSTVRLTSMKRSASASKLRPTNFNNPFDEPGTFSPNKSINAATTSVMSEVLSRVSRNASMRDSGDYFIASVPLNNVEAQDETREEESSEINLSDVVDNAEIFEDSVSYGDPTSLTTIAFEPLKDCKDVISQQLLLKLSTNASVTLLENAVRAKGLTTVGELCSLNIYNIHKLPITPSPKPETFSTVMKSYAQEHYPHLLQLSQDQQEPSPAVNVDEASGSDSVPLGQPDNLPANNVSIDREENVNDIPAPESPTAVANCSLRSDGVSDSETIQGHDDSKSAQQIERLALEPFAAGDWAGFVNRLIDEQLSPEERKAVLVKLFHICIESG